MAGELLKHHLNNIFGDLTTIKKTKYHSGTWMEKKKKFKLLLKHFGKQMQAKKTVFYGKTCIKACLEIE